MKFLLTNRLNYDKHENLFFCYPLEKDQRNNPVCGHFRSELEQVNYVSQSVYIKRKLFREKILLRF